MASAPSSPSLHKCKLWKQCSANLSEGIDLELPDSETTRQLLYEYAGKGLVERLDDDFFANTIDVIDIGDDKVRLFTTYDF